MPSFIEDGKRFRLTDPTLAPNAAAYLWNRKMMIHMTCRGYAVSQYMDPEPRKYAHVPTVAGQVFMLPEQDYFVNHPGRFFYVRDNDSGALWSLPYEPCRVTFDAYAFEPGLSDIRWTFEKDGIRIELRLDIPTDDVLELWTVRISNPGKEKRSLSLVPFFPVGFTSWLNRGGHFDAALNSVVCTCVTPYQKTKDYFKNQHLKDITFLSADRVPDHHECAQTNFEGEGGLHNPTALQNGGNLGDNEAIYQNPAGIMQFDLAIAPGAEEQVRLIFGPARDKDEIRALKSRHLDGGFAQDQQALAAYVASGKGCLSVETPDAEFDHFVNHWLPRQVFYHGDRNRLCTDPQTRNYLQDAMGMVFINPAKTRQTILTSVAQQFASGKMPDGILLHEDAELKYINQVPHTDHAVWLAITVKGYLDETNDWDILDEMVVWRDSDAPASLYEHVTKALIFLAEAVDERGLPYIAEGDWNDPMNMVGYKGKGVSGWLAEASCHALATWIPVAEKYAGQTGAKADADRLTREADALRERVNRYFWDGDWYARGITDDNVTFGVSKDEEGRIYLNAQSWALLCDAPDAAQKARLLKAIDEQLDTPFGPMMLAPAYTHMREDVGRLTQKWPGTTENGSIYNHASAFYAAGLYHAREGDRAFATLRKMLTGANAQDIGKRGQVPLFVPNCYRGAYYQFPSLAGRSSNLFNTGTAAWYYRLVVEQLFGLRGDGDDVIIDPQMPSHWQSARFRRTLRSSEFEVLFRRSTSVTQRRIEVNGQVLEGQILAAPINKKCYKIIVTDPL